VGDAPAVGLIDLQAGDGDRSSLLGEQHRELAQVAVRAVGCQIDRRKALHIDPGTIRQSALGEQVAGGVATDVARIGSEVEELIGRAEDDLGLLDRRAVAFEGVVDPAPNDPAA
jgi:hypothetical protein